MSYPTYEDTYQKQIKIGDQTVEITVGRYSEQTAAAVMAKAGDTMVHTTVALGGKVDWGYFPLHVEYEEKLYAGGIIKGSRWVKREGRPTDEAVLKARVIDRSIRPLFPKGITNQVQVVSTVFSYDGENSDDMLALLSAGIALTISDIPFEGPVAGLRIGYKKEDGQFVFNPTTSQQEELDLDLIVSGSSDSLVMVEAGANEVDEEVVIDGMMKGQQELKSICAAIDQIRDDIGKEKVQLVEPASPEEKEREETISKQLKSKFSEEIHQMVVSQANLEDTGLDQVLEQMVEYLNQEVFESQGEETSPTRQVTTGEIKGMVYELMNQETRRMILEDGVRPDGRKPDEIRSIWCETDIFPRTHGSAMFKRGATQAVTITTLGSPSLGQHTEDMEGEEVSHYFHHYNMPPYAAGETGRFGYPKRREVGHGHLAQRALEPMIPSQAEFPYTIRVVSEILSSNGSTSQASICGSTLSLMAAGVPIKRPVAGIAMGLMSTPDMSNYVVLSDIQGLEDHTGDMDFKVAGTKEGVTAIQMDIKLKGINVDLLRQALERGKAGRMHIMNEMLKCIDQPRQSLSEYAPKVEQISIPSDRIGEVIGPGGKIIKEIINLSGAQVDIEED
ncbi:MAG: polyribonucleotide nucleotidyltransferase, partial [Candidatus Pacebacteria bacterium]|nr:polyribonucleotide nucleotidyltransferase [Candidatus Paceibacterota bacterium]